MNLNHANIFSSDVASMSDIFERFFSFKVESQGENFAMLSGKDGFSLVIMTTTADMLHAYPSSQAFGMTVNTHLGFMTADPQDVYAKHQELQRGGCHPGQIKTFEAVGRRWTAFYCPIGDGIDIEVAAAEGHLD